VSVSRLSYKAAASTQAMAVHSYNDTLTVPYLQILSKYALQCQVER